MKFSGVQYKAAFMAGAMALLGGCGMSFFGADGTKLGPKNEARYEQQFNPLPEELSTYELEQRVEKVFSTYFQRDIDIVTPVHVDLAYSLVVVRKGTLDATQTTLNSGMTAAEANTVEYLVENYNPEILAGLSTYDPRFQELTKLIESGAENELIDATAKANFGEMNPDYAAALFGMTGLTITWQKIYISKNIKNLHTYVYVLAHEAAHTLFTYNSGLADFFMNEHGINETACNIMASRISSLFSEMYLDGKVKEEFDRKIGAEKDFTELKQDLVSKFLAYDPEERLAKRDEIIASLSQEYASHTGSEMEVDEAVLWTWQAYSGDQERFMMLDALERKVGPNKFIELVPTFWNDNDLKEAYGELVLGSE